MGILRVYRLLRVFGCLGIIGIVSVLLLIGGTIQKQEASKQTAKYKQPITLTCEEFEHRHPTEGWFRITGCRFSALDASFLVTKNKDDSSSDTSQDNTNEVMLPVYAKSEDMEKPSHIALFSHDGALLSIVNEMNKLGFIETKSMSDAGFFADTTDTDSSSGETQPSDRKKNIKNKEAEADALLAFAKKNSARIFTSRTVEGMIRSGDDTADNLYSNEQKKILEIGRDHLASQYILFDEGASPARTANNASTEIKAGAIGTIVIGGIFAVIAFAAFGRRGSNGNNGGGTPYARPTYIPPTGGPATGPFYNPPGGPTGGPVNTPPAGQNPWTPTPPPVIYPPVAPPAVPQTPRQPSQPWSLD